MAEGLHLIGYGPSVYTRIVRMALIEMRLSATYAEADPFAESPDPLLAQVSPFGRVPVLQHADFTLTETSAILRYLDQLGPAPSLVPHDAQAAAQMAQVIGIIDFYGYIPLIRDVFAHGYYYDSVGAAPDPARLERGLIGSAPVLRALEAIAQQGRVLNAKAFSLADIHLAPMVDYFVQVPAAKALLSGQPALAAWWSEAQKRPSLTKADPRAHQ